MRTLNSYFYRLGNNSRLFPVYNCICCFKVQPIFGYFHMGEMLKYLLVTIQHQWRRLCWAFCAQGLNWIFLFVCLTTKTIYLKLATDLSTDAFIAAFGRFCARRGKPSKLLSENGTNFIGERYELENVTNFLNECKRDLIALQAIQYAQQVIKKLRNSILTEKYSSTKTAVFSLSNTKFGMAHHKSIFGRFAMTHLVAEPFFFSNKKKFHDVYIGVIIMRLFGLLFFLFSYRANA